MQRLVMDAGETACRVSAILAQDDLNDGLAADASYAPLGRQIVSGCANPNLPKASTLEFTEHMGE